MPHVQGNGPVGPMSTAPAMQAESLPPGSPGLCVSAFLRLLCVLLEAITQKSGVPTRILSCSSNLDCHLSLL